MSKRAMIAMIFILIFTLAGCKSKGRLEDKAGEPIASDENTKEGETSNVEDTSDNMIENTDIIMTTEKDTHARGVKEINITIENKTSYEYYYGVAFTLEQNVNGEWILVTPKEDVFVIEIAYILEANGTGTIVSDLVPYGDLADGQYRIVKEMIKQTMEEEDGTTAPENIKVAAEFTII